MRVILGGVDMVNEFLHLLKEGNEERVKDYIFDKELEFYGNDKLNSEIVSTFEGDVEDKLMNILKIDDETEPVYSSISDDDNSENNIKIYNTSIYNLFLIKKPKFSELVFTSDIRKIIENIKEKIKNLEKQLND